MEKIKRVNSILNIIFVFAFREKKNTIITIYSDNFLTESMIT